MWSCHLQLLVASVSALGEAEQSLDVGLCLKSVETSDETSSQEVWIELCPRPKCRAFLGESCFSWGAAGRPGPACSERGLNDAGTRVQDDTWSGHCCWLWSHCLARTGQPGELGSLLAMTVKRAQLWPPRKMELLLRS